MEFIVGIKLIEDKMGRRKVSVPNDDTAGKRILNTRGPSRPRLTSCRQSVRDAFVTCTTYVTYVVVSQSSGFGMSADPEYARCLPSEKTVNNLSRDEEWQNYRNNLWLWILNLVVAYWKNLHFWRWILFFKKYMHTQNVLLRSQMDKFLKPKATKLLC